MDRVGIIGAMDEEVQLYISALSHASEVQASGFTFYLGEISGKRVVVAKSGAGKVNASMCAQLLISKFGSSAIIFTGVAGAINPLLNAKDIVISSDSIQHDMDAKGLGFEKGQIPFTSHRFFPASDSLRKGASSAARRLGLKSVEGRVLSGDQFIVDKEKSRRLRKEFSGECVDMESAAVAHVCHVNDVPHIIIRSISDKADSAAPVDFKAFSKEAAKNSFLLVMELLKKNIVLASGWPAEDIKSKVRTIPNWPKKGVMFRDITTVLKDKEAFNAAIDLLVSRYSGTKIDAVVGIESRGFITGAAIAHALGIGFIPIRKHGKLPAETISEEYELEYGKSKIEIHKDAIAKGMKLLLVDDLIATGGTALAACKLVEKLGGKISECCFLIDLPDLGGAKRLEKEGYKVFSIMQFEGK